jgi:glucokinase
VKSLDEFYLGLDIGGTNVRIAYYHEAKRTLAGITRVPFKKANTVGAEIEMNIDALIQQAITGNGFRPEGLKGVGISLAALFDRRTGEITTWPNNRLWNGFPLKQYLSQNLKVPVVLEDDANSAGFGEYLAGAGKRCDNFAYITVSTGIGCGLILGGSLFTGAHGWAGEIGHIPIVTDGPLCKCGKRGCLQSLASGPALLNRGRELAAEAGVSVKDLTDLKEVVRLASAGTGWAMKVFDEAGNYLSNIITYLVMTLDLPLIVLGGGVLQAGDLILYPISKGLGSFFSDSGRGVEVKVSQLGDDNGVIGALSLIYKHINGVTVNSDQ